MPDSFGWDVKDVFCKAAHTCHLHLQGAVNASYSFLCWMQENQCNKQAYDKSVLSSKIDSLTQEVMAGKAKNAILTAKNSTLQNERDGLSESLSEQCAINGKSKDELQRLQNNFSLQSEALASKARQLSEVLLCKAAAEVFVLQACAKLHYIGATTNCLYVISTVS